VLKTYHFSIKTGIYDIKLIYGIICKSSGLNSKGNAKGEFPWGEKYF
jgi:hypothetical protein